MINLLLGRPGAGKSYEAVVYHILEAVKSGRKVITNIPLNIAHFKKVFGDEVQALLDVRQFGFHDYGTRRPFSTPDEYADKWRNDKGQGPLYVIDECHLSLPRGGKLVEIEEWFSMHRHYGVDVLLITQSYSKVSKVIIEMVEICYQCTKARFLGFDNSYIRKTRDGVRGEVIHTETRKYKKAFFAFYQSHTQSNKAVLEAGAADVKPLYKQWPVIGGAIFIPLGIAALVAVGNPMDANNYIKKANDAPPVSQKAAAPSPAPVVHQSAQVNYSPPPAPVDHPFSSVSLSIDGYAVYTDHGRRVAVAWFALHREGRTIARIDNAELELAGYQVQVKGDCLAKVSYASWSRWVICDAPPEGEIVADVGSLGDAATANVTGAVGSPAGL